MDYNIKYELLNYDKLMKRLNDILNNKKNIFQVIKHKPIGFSSCNFPIDHYSIGHGKKHIIYFAGCHGNEIIGVDFVTQLMNNLALGKGNFQNFPDNIYTIDFIPLLNPEGFYITTYALSSVTSNLNDQKLEEFCERYFLAYKKDDQVIKNINNLIKDVCKKMNIINISDEVINKFWLYYHDYEIITKYNLLNFFKLYIIDNENINKIIDELMTLYFNNDRINIIKEHQNIFNNISLDVIPNIDNNHQILKNKLKVMYQNNLFPISTLANFYANSNGVNLNDNNPYYYDYFKKRLIREKEIYAKGRENNILISSPSPIGMPNYDMNKPFKYENENKALLNFFQNYQNSDEYFMSFNCHSTGGLLYAKPIYNDSMFKSKIATEYINKINEVYKNMLNQDITYEIMPKGKMITGIGDLLREKYRNAYLLELSKMGGNPIGPYGDRKNNYEVTIIANMEALSNILRFF